jgi:hypothetical protein
VYVLNLGFSLGNHYNAAFEACLDLLGL